VKGCESNERAQWMILGPGSSAGGDKPLEIIPELFRLKHGAPLQAFRHEISTGLAQRTTLHTTAHCT